MTDAMGAELRGRSLLVVEDDYIIATDLASSLEKRGLQVIGPVGTVYGALKLIETTGPLHGAVLDINLGGEMVYPVADELTRRSVPFVFATGYSASVIPTAYADVSRLEKPVDTAALARKLAHRIETFIGQSP